MKMKTKAATLLSLFLLLLGSMGVAISPTSTIRQSEPELAGDAKSETLRFHGHTDKNCYVVAMSSSHPIHIQEFDFRMNWHSYNNSTSGAYFGGVCVTNGSYFSAGFGGAGEANREGNLRYVYFDWGRFNYLYDDRYIFDETDGGTTYNDESNHTLSPGTWYLIFAQGVFDLRQEQVHGTISVWINLSDSSGVSFDTTEGGKIYALWYGEFNANLVVSSYFTFEMLLGGNVQFHINNTFVYSFWSWPAGQGFWRVKWIKPGGVVETLNMVTIRGYHIPDIFTTGECEAGIGGSGNYTLKTSAIDYWPPVNRLLWHLFPWYKRALWVTPLYFIGLDVKLP